MDHPQSLPWADPLEYAASLNHPQWALLYSGVQASYSGRYSLLAYDLAERVEAENFASLAPRLTATQPPYSNAWFGYFGYGLKNILENLPHDRPSWLALPALTFMRFHHILEFDHHTKTANLYSSKPHTPPTPAQPTPIYLPPVSGPITSNMSKTSYLAKAADLITRIHAGELYQANLTRKFTGRFTAPPTPFDVFRKLCAVSPAAYSSFLNLGDTAILSSSPELFLKIDATGQIRSRPVKGTTPPHPDPAQDLANKEALAASPKDRAENLMILDLMRNDLARSCTPGSVKTSDLFEVTSHSNVHHMSSTVTGQKTPAVNTLQAIMEAFPPGSMTGAPKVMAMRLLSALEQDERSVYSGALGWLGGDGSAELSVVIRTLLLSNDRFEFQVGGGIVADSTPEGELQETIDKASGILKLLGLDSTAISF